MASVRPQAALLAVLALASACSPGAPADEALPASPQARPARGLTRLTARWPMIDDLAAAARAHPPKALANGRYRLESTPRNLAAEIDTRDGSLSLELPSLASPIRVRRGDSPAQSAAIEEHRLLVTRAGNETLLFATARGVEELVVAHEPGIPLSYDFELPAGYSLAHDGAAAITISDSRGTPVARAVFLSGWDATGQRFVPELATDGPRISVSAPSGEGLSWPVLIDPEWIGAAVPAYPRSYGGLTLLPDGRVLVSGGYELGDAPSEIYDPVHGVFKTLGEPLAPRQNHSATLLRDGTVLLAGGTIPDADDDTLDEPLATLDRLDPRLGTIDPLGSLPAPRSSHTATRLNDGSVLIVGGERPGVALPYEALSDAYRVAEDGSFAAAGSLTRPRARHTASRLPDGRVVIAGGLRWEPNPDQVPVVEDTLEVFEEANNTFSLVPGSMAAARATHFATVFDDGQLLLGWGQSAYVCNSTLESWSYPALALFDSEDLQAYYGADQACVSPGTPAVQLADGFLLRNPLRIGEGFVLEGAAVPEYLEHIEGWSTALLANGTVLATGKGLASVFDLQPAHETLANGSFDEERGRAAGVTLADGRVLVVGGRHIDTSVEAGEEVAPPDFYPRSAFLFDPIDEAVGEPIATSKARIDHTVTRLDDGRALVLGGSNEAGEDNRPSELFDPLTATFAPGPALTLERAAHTSTRLADGRVLIVGGTLEDRHAELFDPTTNDLDLSGELALPRLGNTAVRLADGRVAILGGDVAPETPTASVEVFDPATGTFSTLGALAEPRAHHASTLLPSGKIFVVGGFGFGGELTSIETFDPETGLSTHLADHEQGWLARPSANLLPDGAVQIVGAIPPSSVVAGNTTIDGSTPELPIYSLRGDHRITTLLPGGDLLVIGGEAFYTYKQKNKHLYGRQWWRHGRESLPGAPMISSYPPLVNVGASVTLQGERFVGPTEGASGDTRQSAGDVPIVEWMPLEGGPAIRGQASQWSDTSLTWTVPQTTFHGPGFLWVVTRGKRSPGALVKVERANNGVACTLSLECGSGSCADGVCCDRDCSGCEACSADKKGSGVDGVCEALAAGTSPEEADTCGLEPTSTCGHSGFCDGLGACQLYPDGTECVAGATCQLGLCTVLEATCDGDHQIVKGDASLGDCAPFRCSLETNACLTACESNLDCVAGLVCDDAGACVAPAAATPAANGCSATREPPARAFWAALLAAALTSLRRRRVNGARSVRRS